LVEAHLDHVGPAGAGPLEDVLMGVGGGSVGHGFRQMAAEAFGPPGVCLEQIGGLEEAGPKCWRWRS